ncbi:MAG TPA: thiamine phosphate synthase [Thermoanaerobaculia bacterium]
MRPPLAPVYAITDRAVSGIADVSEIARRLLAVGVRCLQVREKGMADRELLRTVETVGALGRERRATVLVDDRVDVARIAGVGVHLGEENLPAAEARAILGPSPWIGVSTHEEATARRAFGDASADYVSFGPVFESATKTGRPAQGLGELRRVAASKTKPLVAIGGITPEVLDAVWDSGADSAAMIGGLLSGGRIEENARRALDLARRRRRPGRIYLVGFMGSGKTAVGQRLAERLAIPFVDLDAEIERTSGKTIRALFEESGEAAFREREAAFLDGTELLTQAVVATGGGCFVREGNRDRIARLGTSVFLDVSLPTVRERLAGKTDRPLFQSVEQLEQLFAERAPFYRMAAVHVSLHGTETVDEAADQVLVALEDREMLFG